MKNGYSYEWINKTTSPQKRDSDTMQHGELRSYRGSRLFSEFFLQFSLPPVLILQLQWHLQDRRGIVLHLLRARLLHQLQQHQVTVGLENRWIKVKLILLQCLCQVQILMIEHGNPLTKPTKNPKSNKNENHETERATRSVVIFRVKPVVCRETNHVL